MGCGGESVPSPPRAGDRMRSKQVRTSKLKGPIVCSYSGAVAVQPLV